MIGPRITESLRLVAEHRIVPSRCKQCGDEDGDFEVAGATVDAPDEKNDTGDLIWRCDDCGEYSSLSADEIQQRVQALGCSGGSP